MSDRPVHPQDTPVRVVGAGIIGLTAAVTLAEAGHPVRVWSADDPFATTTARAPGVWRATYQAPLDRTLAWADRSLRQWCALESDPTAGVRLVEAVTVGPLPPFDDLPAQIRLSPDLRPCRPDEIPPGFDRGLHSRTPLVDVPRHVGWLLRRLRVFGTAVEIRRARSLDKARDEAPVVVNAAGTAAGALADDTSVRPVFSQQVVVENPGLDRVVHEITESRRWVSVVPHDDRVHLGGVRVPGRTDLTPDGEETARILHDCRAVEPLLGDTSVLRVETELLPARPMTRVEADPHRGGLVVHDYGHGHDGLALAWGAAAEVARLVRAHARG